MPQQGRQCRKGDDQRQYLKCDDQRRAGPGFQDEGNGRPAGIAEHITRPDQRGLFDRGDTLIGETDDGPDDRNPGNRHGEYDLQQHGPGDPAPARARLAVFRHGPGQHQQEADTDQSLALLQNRHICRAP